ncbi:MAG: LysR family transcriptional regulator [Oligoflexia bacterium]|nr:LysR family transcriptional regulator [Oligoflexia bacterium]
MSISSIYLDAFISVAKTLSFSRAAKQLHVTQSALSQRIKNLEDDLGLTLFIRNPSGIILTESGERLLKYAQIRDALEEEALHDLVRETKDELAGIVRIAAYSSVLRSVIIPSMSNLLFANPKIQCHFICGSMVELPGLLQRAEVDFIVMDYAMEKSSIEKKVLGTEEYVVISSKKTTSRDDIYLDNNPDDMATENFMRFQKKPVKYKRSYMSDCYGIIDGVVNGIGRSVMSRHLVDRNLPVRIVKGFKPYTLDVVLHYNSQPFYTRLQKAVIDELTRNSSKFLK